MEPEGYVHSGLGKPRMGRPRRSAELQGAVRDPTWPSLARGTEQRLPWRGLGRFAPAWQPPSRIRGSASSSPSATILNFNGHSHNYERFVPIHRVVHITAAGGGSSLETPWRTRDPRTVFRAMHLAPACGRHPGRLLIQALCGPSSSADELACRGRQRDRFVHHHGSRIASCRGREAEGAVTAP
jgi:hypothetical protein